MVYFCTLLAIYGIGTISRFKIKNEKQQELVEILLLFPLFALCAFRAISVGNDTYTYYYGFSRIGNYSSLFSVIRGSRYEVGYAILTYCLNKLNFSFISFQVITSLFIYFSFFRFFKKYSTNYSFSCFIFLSLRYAMSTMNVIRMWIAIAILLYAIPFVQQRKLRKFLLCVIISSCFHSTALVFAILYPAVKLQINRKTILYTITISTIILLAGKPLFQRITSIIGRYSGYLNSIYFNFDSNIAIYLTLAINFSLFILIYLSMNKTVKNKMEIPTNNISIEKLCVTCGLLVTAFSIIGLGNTIMDRISVYYGFIFTISIPLSLLHIKNHHNRVLLNIGIIIALITQFLVVMILRPGWNGVTPYLFYWQQ